MLVEFKGIYVGITFNVAMSHLAKLRIKIYEPFPMGKTTSPRIVKWAYVA